MIRARTRCRVDLAGGTLDIWPLGLFFPVAQTSNVALDLAVVVTMERRAQGYVWREEAGEPREFESAEEMALDRDAALVGVVAHALDLPPLHIATRSDSPRGGGLGASSALTMALIAAGDRLLGHPPREPAQAARLARDLEARLMRLPTGTQDHYPAVLGGSLAVRFLPGGERAQRLNVDLDGLARHLVLIYSGQSHFSAATNWEIIRRTLEAEPEVLGLLSGIAEIAAEMSAPLEAGDWATVGDLVGREWQLRRHLADGVSVPAVDSLLQMARSLGAWGGKACGAGGGGCVAILCPAERRETLVRTLATTGGEVLAARPTPVGLELDEL